MTAFLGRYATPLFTGLFVVSLVSGVALFFHLWPAGFHAMHEWLSMVLILPFGLHVWKNWRPMTAYFRRAPMAVALALSAVAAVPFAMAAGAAGHGAGGPAQMALAQRVMMGTAAEVAPLVGATGADVAARLAAAGFTVADAGQPLAEIARASGRSERELAAVLVAMAPR